MWSRNRTGANRKIVRQASETEMYNRKERSLAVGANVWQEGQRSLAGGTGVL